MTSSGKKIILGLLLVVVLGIVTFIVLTIDTGKEPPVTKTEQEETEKDKEKEEEDKKEEKKEEDKEEDEDAINSIEECQEKYKEENLDRCISNVAFQDNNRDKCDSIEDEKIRKRCGDKILFQEISDSSSAKDMEKCTQMETDDYIRKCYNRILVNASGDINQEACEVFDDEEVQRRCAKLANFKSITMKEGNNIQDCQKLEEGGAKKECIQMFAERKNITDKTVCEEFQGDTKDYCESFVD